MSNGRRPRRAGFLARRRIPRLAATLADANLGYHYRNEAARALADLGGEEAVAALLAHLHASPRQVQRSVVIALGHIGDPRSAPALLRLLGESEGDVHKAALAALRRTGLPPDLEPLVRGLGARSGPALSAQAMGELVEVFGDPVVPLLVRMAADPGLNSGVRLGALRTVLSRDLPGAEDAVRRAAEDPAPELRRAAVTALARMPDSPRATEALIGRLDDEDPDVRSHAFTALSARADRPGLLDGPRAKETAALLAPFLRHDQLSRRREAAALLGLLGWEPPDDRSRAAYLAAGGEWERIPETGRAGLAVAQEWLDRDDLDWFVRGVRADVGSSSRPRALTALLRLADPEVEAVAEAAHAGSESAMRALRWLARSGRPSSRRAASVLAGLLAERRDVLYAELDYEPEWAQPDVEDNPWGYDGWETTRWAVRVAAASTLAQLGDGHGIRALREALLAGAGGAASALTRVGGLEAAQVLEEAGRLDALASVKAAPDFPGADADL